MSNGGRHPPRPGVMAGGGVGQGWVPGVNMPPLGYGLVAQQPHIAPHQPIMAPAQQAWQQQQQQQHFMTQQTGLVGGPLGLPTLTQQQQQFPQHLQQQWLEAQRKAVEEQRKLYGQMVKQRQFDEQKMRLKAFSTSKKTGVSADTMIENILGGKEPSKQRSPQPPKKTQSGQQSTQGNHQLAPTPQAAQTLRQGTAVDWTKLENVNALFASPKKPATAIPPAEHSTNPTTTTTTTTTAFSSPQDTHSRVPGDTVQPPASFLNMGDSGSRRKDGENVVTFPQWMKDSATLPEVYKRAGGLVSAPEGWVDTSRAYMLLMKTGLPPPLLGVLWEMVNCTTPGQLTQTEFSALLSLVALVQCGQPITGPEVFGAMQDPPLPLIDHPALAPLVRDDLQARQQQQQHGVETGAGVGETAGPTSNSITSIVDDEFDDFVSVTVPPNSAMLPPQAPSSSSFSVSSFPSQNPGGFIGPAQTAPQPPVEAPPPQAADKNRAMNLPKLGLSPEPSPGTSFDDDFDDFQSASLPCIPQAAPATGGQPVMTNPARPTEQPLPAPLLQPEKIAVAGGEDKYAVFREMAGGTEEATETTESADDSFGEFCSSEVASLNLAQSTSASTLSGLLQCQSTSGTSNTSPISFEVYSTPPEALPDTQTDVFEADFSSAFASPRPPPDNYADIHEALRRAEAEQKYKEESKWSDPFGEFEEAPPPLSATAAAASTTAGASGVGCGSEEEEDEDFGDFMGPSGGIGGGSSIHTLPPPLENLGETQSVASLELPGLEMTVGVVDTAETLAIGSNHSPDLFLQPRGALEDQLSGLGLESATTGSISTTQQQQQQQTGSVMDPYCSSGGLVDKYSIIRQEDSQHHGEAHTGSWERCLEGSIKVLQEARSILGSLSSSSSLKSQVLATSQMQDYLANVQEVWLVCGRIRASSRRVTTSTQVDHLLSEAQTLWHDVLAAAGADSVIAKPQVDISAGGEEGDNQMGEGEVCGVCLTGGGARLTYGGHSYHPPCANLWLNRVDLLLPCLTPVTLL